MVFEEEIIQTTVTAVDTDNSTALSQSAVSSITMNTNIRLHGKGMHVVCIATNYCI